MLFTQDELQEILSALRIAEDRYATDARREEAAARDHCAESHARLALQFARKARIAHAVADKVAATAAPRGARERMLETV